MLPPKKDPFDYLQKLLNQLQRWEIIDQSEADRFVGLSNIWATKWSFMSPELIVIHGDATPEHFLYDENRKRMGIIDVETLRSGDPAEDLGYLTGELKHLFWSYTGDPWASEPYIRQFYADYMGTAGPLSSHLLELTDRGRFFMGCVELRIARNSWLPIHYRRQLIMEAERCLTI